MPNPNAPQPDERSTLEARLAWLNKRSQEIPGEMDFLLREKIAVRAEARAVTGKLAALTERETLRQQAVVALAIDPKKATAALRPAQAAAGKR